MWHAYAITRTTSAVACLELFLLQLFSYTLILLLFLFSDARAFHADIAELKKLIAPLRLVRFLPSTAQWEQHGPGGAAIVDQWISAHAR